MTRDRRKEPNTRPLSLTEADTHLERAEEYLRTAQFALSRGDLNAAGGNAVLAGINAGDCVAGHLRGERWNGPHEQAAAHVSLGGPEGRAVAVHLRQLIRKKTQTHYQTRGLSEREAETLVLSAQRAVRIARRVAARNRTGPEREGG